MLLVPIFPLSSIVVIEIDLKKKTKIHLLTTITCSTPFVLSSVIDCKSSCVQSGLDAREPSTEDTRTYFDHDMVVPLIPVHYGPVGLGLDTDDNLVAAAWRKQEGISVEAADTFFVNLSSMLLLPLAATRNWSCSAAKIRMLSWCSIPWSTSSYSAHRCLCSKL